jgi:hypothetical protein
MTMTTFHFYAKLDQTLLLGQKGKNVPGLLEGIKSAPESCIYYHTHRFLQQHHYLSPEPPNDFAYWVTEVLGDKVLGEQLSSVDTIQFESISELRDKFISLIESYLASMEKIIDCPRGEEFHFMASRTFALPTPYFAQNLIEFRNILGHVSVSTIYYHIFDAKLRLGRGENDFSRWFDSNGMSALAEEVRNLDPYTYTLEGLRKRILVLTEKHDTN